MLPNRICCIGLRSFFLYPAKRALNKPHCYSVSYTRNILRAFYSPPKPFHSTSYNRLYKFKRPFTFLGGALLFGGVGDYVLREICSNRRIKPIDKKLEEGSNPAYPRLSTIVRDKLEKDIQYFLQPSSNTNDVEMFGLIIGPSGSGKTCAVKKVCSQNPSGILYFEISEAENFHEKLAEEIGMQIKPGKTYLGLLFDRFTNRYPYYHRLPEKKNLALSYVLDTFEQRAILYAQKHKSKPCLVIDGVDLLAKHLPEIFTNLIEKAKFYTCRGIFRIVLVSSEGKVMPIIKNTSGITRLKNILEVGGIDDGDAVYYLVNRFNIPQTMATNIVEITGGRFFHLNKAAELLTRPRLLTLSNEDKLKQIERNFSKDVMNDVLVVMLKNDVQIVLSVLNELSQNNVLDRWDTLKRCNAEKRASKNKVLNDMIEVNILRYQSDGKLTWHSKVAEAVIRREKKDFDSWK